MAMTNTQPGKLFYVIGASGSGKDSLMNFAQSRLASVEKIIFTHRYITRPPELQGENHVYLKNDEFQNRKNRGFFSMYWESHGLFYGIGSEINLWLAEGYDVVVNGSRAYLPNALNIFPEMQVILVSTSPKILRERLLKRNRETPEEIEARLHRAMLFNKISCPRLIKLNNDTALAQSGTLFVDILSKFGGNIEVASSDPQLESKHFQIRLLGTGNALGVPVRGCSCDICTKAKSITSFRRKSSAALIEFGEKNILIDAGITDLKDRFPGDNLSAILLTHFHPDHIQGLFAFRWGNGEKINTYSPLDPIGCGDLYKNPGVLDFKPVNPFESFNVAEITITAVPLIHSKPTLGYCFEHESVKLAYLTDTIGLPNETTAFLINWQPDLIVLDCSFPPATQIPRNHNDITNALEIFAEIKPKKMLLTHIDHKLDLWLSHPQNKLPPGVNVAQDNDVWVLR